MNLRNTLGIGLVGILALTLGGTVGAQEAAAPKPPVVELIGPENSAVEAILGTNPSTPTEWARTAKILADLNRPDLAKGFLKKILDAKLDAAQLAAMEEQFGSGMFVSMGSRADLLPEGKQVADAVLLAVEQKLTDVPRLEGLIKQLRDPSAETRYRAMDGLRRARGAAVGPLVAVLGDPSQAAEHDAVRAMLADLRVDAVEPLVGVLETSDANLLVGVMPALAELNIRSAIPFLLVHATSEKSPPQVRQAATEALTRLVGHAPTKAEAAKLLAQRAQEYFDQKQALPADLDGRVVLWSWDAAKKQPVIARYARDDASRLLAARLAREAYAISPEDAAIRRLYLATLLEKAAYDHGLGKPLPSEAGSPAALAGGFDVKVLEDVLVWTIDSEHTAAAAVAARTLGIKGTAEELLCQGAQPAPLVRALRYPDRRLRFAALEAILAQKPARPFAGSNLVTDALAYFIATSGARRALVADYSREEARMTGGLLIALGYQVDTAVSGQELVGLAIASPDYELVMVAASLGKSTVAMALQQLRFDSRTAWLPVGILGRLGQSELTETLARGDRLAQAFVRPHTEEDARWQVDQLMDRLGRRHVPFEERQAQAAQALAWLGDLSAQDKTVFDLRRLEELVLAAHRAPALMSLSLKVLGGIGTPKGQQTLVERASQFQQPLEARQTALAAFRQSVEKHGLLLTSQQILLQYDRYNQSANQDRDSQQVLGAILDCIEARSKRGQKDQAEKK